ncbi:MAG: CBS domain-containing protein [Candidatus Melainabacteria bacterium]|nr:CBS domain-containing protein [Candidatus Melainabacteria bacterium]MBI3309450.1 CBS domain-containing protein [Candidatus Melainabacteria bacterium]
MYIKDVMKTKPYFLHKDDTIASAYELMSSKKIRHIPIINENQELIGLVTQRDIAGALAKREESMKIAKIMKKEIITVCPDTPLKGVIEVMILNKYGCLPVVDSNNKLIGIVTETDMLQTLYEVATLPADFYKIEK